MAISGLQVIDIGLQNESTGSDSLYTAFNKAKNNFSVIANTATPFPTFTGNTGINVVANSTSATVDVTNTGVVSIIAGTNITVDSANGNVTISSTGGGGSGTVTSVGVTPISNARLVVTDSPITSSGNISIDLANSGVTAGSYTLPNVTVDNYGRITTISNGTSIGSEITNGNSNVVVGANSNVTISVNGTSGVLVISNTGTTVTGNLVASNVSGTLVTGTLTTAAQPNITSVGSLTSLIVSGNINAANVSGGNTVSANYFVGSGNNLSNIQAANITGRVANATYANTAGSASSSGTASYASSSGTATTAGVANSASYAGNVTLGAQPNITSVGTLTSLIVNGNTNAGNVIVSGIFKLGRLTSAQIANLSATNGDMVYNSTLNKFQGYENGAWANLI